jgi:PilX N-terminal
MMLNNLNTQHGFGNVAVGLVLLFASSLITLYAAKSAIIETKVASNDYQAKLAFEAAEAGVEFGHAYLEANRDLILIDADSDGFINQYTSTSTQNVTLTNNTTYTISYTNINANDFSSVRISAIGTSPDGTITRTVTQEYANRPYTLNMPAASLIAKGNVALSGNLDIENTINDTTIWSGGATSFTGSASTTISTGTGSDRNSTGADVIQNDGTLASLSSDQFFENFFSSTKTEARKSANILYQNSVSTNYADSLDGVVGKVIWIDQTSGEAQINSNVTIGSPEQPVLLIVNGDFHLNGNMTLYGSIYVADNWDNSGGGTATVHGSAIIEGDFSGQGTPNIVYNPTILNRSRDVLGDFAIVAGSWRDM